MNAVAARAGRAPVLVIGVGSELRRDDAVGRRVVERLETDGLGAVEVRSLHQLTPELAVEISGRRQVVFVDASVEVSEVTVVPLEPQVAATSLSHHLDPASLLALTARIGEPPQQAVAVHVPARDLGLGTRPSPEGRRAIAQALVVVQDLVAP